jgi:hypothetical protein
MRAKFPQAHGLRRESGVCESSEPAVSCFAAEAFPLGAVSEVVPAVPGSGCLMLWIAGLLGAPESASSHPDLVLVDGADAFDPESFTGNACAGVLWVRCRTALQMLKSVDLVVRDGNVPWVVLDTTGLARQDLQSLPAAAWWRLRQAAERTGCRVVVLAEYPLVPCASLRRSLAANLSLADFDRPRAALLGRLQWVSQDRRQAT